MMGSSGAMQKGNWLSVRLAPFLLAVMLSPLCAKTSVGVSVSYSDILILCSLILLFPELLNSARQKTLQALIAPVLPFLMVASLSAVEAHNAATALREVIKLLSYFIGVTLLANCAFCGRESRLLSGGAISVAAAIGLAGCILVGTRWHEQAGIYWGTQRGLAFSTMLFIILVLVMIEQKAPKARLCSYGIAAALCLVPIATVLLSPAAATTEPQPVSQALREAYASVSIMSKAPIFGVGAGNYQVRIDEFYQGMPKENSLVPGNQNGYCIILATTGVFGLAAFLYWIGQLTTITKSSCRPATWSLLLLVIGWGFFTPLLTSQVLLPLALTNAVVCIQRNEQ